MRATTNSIEEPEQDRPSAEKLTDDALLQKTTVRRYFWVPLGLSMMLGLLVLAALAVMSWRSLERLQPLQAHLQHIARIQDAGLSMEQTLLRGLRGAQFSESDLRQLSESVRAIALRKEAAHPGSDAQLQQIAQRLADPVSTSNQVLFDALTQLRSVLVNERQQHDEMLLRVADSTRLEMNLAFALLVALPIAGGIGLWFLWRGFAQPLRDLQNLLNRLSGRDFRPVPQAMLEHTTKLAQPAFASYNLLVSRLQALEAEHQDRERLLETRVREATSALLAQSRELSRAERLAAVGAVSAGLAHELRNPLAGIQLACAKLQKKLGESAESQRISSVILELDRVNHLLNAQLDRARHAPEAASDIDLHELVAELLGLLRYQIPSGFDLHSQIAVDTRCHLPAAGLRQALLNLLLNAVHIQGEQGEACVSAELSEHRVVIHVDDHGPGFSQEQLRAGVRPFATGRDGGTGLGLAMVRRFVRELDGDLELLNRQSQGARVTLSLPCESASARGGNRDA